MVKISITTETKALLKKVSQEKKQDYNKVLHNLLKNELDFINERKKIYENLSE